MNRLTLLPLAALIVAQGLAVAQSERTDDTTMSAAEEARARRAERRAQQAQVDRWLASRDRQALKAALADAGLAPAGERPRTTGERTRTAGERTRIAGERTRDAGERTRDAGERTRDAGEATRTAGEPARKTRTAAAAQRGRSRSHEGEATAAADMPVTARAEPLPLAADAVPAAAAIAPTAVTAATAPTVATPVAAAAAPAFDAEALIALAPPTAGRPAAAPLPPLPPAAVASPAPAAALPLPDARFDLAVNNAAAPQVFMQLASGTGYNMLVAPEVSGTISVTLRDTTVLEAMESLRELFGYDFRVAGNRIFVYPNTVQTKLYRINYLPGRRQGASDTRVTSSAISQSGAGGTSGSSAGGTTSSGTSGSGGSGPRADDSAHVRTTSDADFWREVQSSLVTLVGGKEGRSVVINIAAGVIVVKATPNELRQVEQYLKAVQLSIERQVMLEAKIVEVALSKDSQTGINWSGFGKIFGGTSAAVGMAAPGSSLTTSGQLSSGDGNTVGAGATLATGSLGRGFYGLALQSSNFAALLNFLQTQGQVSVLSSPRIATLNNQKAVLKVGSDELYVTGVSTTTTNNTAGSVSTPSVTLQPFFSGIALDVTPQIDDAGNVMLHVHPSISTVAEKTKNVDLGSLGAFKLPLAASTVNETDSIVRVKDGQIVAIGGLMKQELRDEKTGLPVLQDVPVAGALFRQSGVVVSKRELVIMLKPTVIEADGKWPEAPAVSQLEPR